MDILKFALRIILVAVLALAAFAQSPGITGTWVGTAELPDQTIDDVTVVLEKTEIGYKGKVSDARGVLAPETPLTEAAFDGKQMKLVFPTAEGEMITILLKPEGEKFVGMWTDEGDGSGKVEIARKK